MNFQLRFSPNVLALRDLLARRELGEIVDIEVRLVVKQPWHLWRFLERAPRLEILYHSIHYLDTIRALVGEPRGVYCRAVAHPPMPEFRGHAQHDHSRLRQCAPLLAAAQPHAPAAGSARRIVPEGGGHPGAAQLTLGVNIDYPNGPRDTLEVALEKGRWQPVD